MIPRLRALYGGSWREWVHEMPEVWFWAHARMLGRLRAENSRSRIDQALASNNRHLNDGDQRAYIAALDREIAAADRPSAPRLSVRQMQQGGMRVIRETVKAASPVSRVRPGERPGARKEVST